MGPRIICIECASCLSQWFNRTGPGFSFGVPVIWREQRDHTTDCYFCMTSGKGFNGKNKKSITYPNLTSAIRPITHSDDIPVPTPPVSLSDSDSTSSDGDSNEDNLYYQPENSQIRHIISQVELNDLVRECVRGVSWQTQGYELCSVNWKAIRNISNDGL